MLFQCCSSRLSRSARGGPLQSKMARTVEAKIVTVGAEGVGKTSIVLRQVTDLFRLNTAKTIGASFFTFSLFLKDVRLKVQLWDTAGQERFRSMAPLYYRRSNAALIVYDITNLDSFESAKTWIREIKDRVDRPIVMFLIGNKLDLLSQREVSEKMADDYAGSIGAIHMLTSAANGDGVSELFVRAVDELSSSSSTSPHYIDGYSESFRSHNDLYTPVSTPPMIHTPHSPESQTPLVALRQRPGTSDPSCSSC